MTRCPVGNGVDEAVEDTDAVLAAYRERKRQALEAARTVDNAQVGAVADPAAHEPAPPAPAMTVATPGLDGPAAVAPTRVPSALDVQRPAPPASSPGATLSPLGPALRLSEALLKDTRVSMRGSPRTRAVGVALLLLGLALAVVERRQAALDAPVPGLSPVTTLGLAAALLVVVGALTAILGILWPRSRRLAVRLAASQGEEWKRIQAETRRLQVQARIGLAFSIAGLALIAAAYSLASLAVLLAGGVLAAVGLPLLAIAQVRRGLARRLYVQTLVLSGLEASGIRSGAPDDRVQPVIIALDRLLGALPEAEVQAFLATPQARAYLELVDEATRSQRGP